VTENPTLILASGSPRRRELLDSLDVDYVIRPADVDESILARESPTEHVQRLATDKAAAIAHQGELILGADTIVLIDDEILGKPADTSEARIMLRRLTGRVHQVLSGVALLDASSGRSAVGLARTEVRIAEISDKEIDWYVSTREPMDKAGAYAIQGLGALFVEHIEGNYTNVVGLPIPLTRSLFRDLGFDLRGFRVTDSV
jgi:septum formation protein